MLILALFKSMVLHRAAVSTVEVPANHCRGIADFQFTSHLLNPCYC